MEQTPCDKLRVAIYRDRFENNVTARQQADAIGMEYRYFVNLMRILNGTRYTKKKTTSVRRLAMLVYYLKDKDLI